jgi:hypothetical protein
MHATTQLIGFTLGSSLNRLEPIHATTQLSGMQLTPCLSPHANIKWAKPLSPIFCMRNMEWDYLSISFLFVIVSLFPIFFKKEFVSLLLYGVSDIIEKDIIVSLYVIVCLFGRIFLTFM